MGCRIFEHTCAYALWAHMHRFLSVRPSVPGPKFTITQFISQKQFDLGSPNWYVDKHYQSRFALEVKGHMGHSQRSYGSRSNKGSKQRQVGSQQRQVASLE